MIAFERFVPMADSNCYVVRLSAQVCKIGYRQIIIFTIFWKTPETWTTKHV